MFPLSDSAKAARFPIITILFIAINIYVFYLQLTVADPDSFIFQYALVPSTVDFSNYTTLVPFITAMFLHGGFLHIISNMWFLWIFGDNIEGFFGKFFYPLVYLITGLVGNVLQYITMPESAIPMLGASGAVSGVLGAYYVLFPHSRIKTFVFMFFLVTVAEIPAVIYLFYWFFLQFISGVGSIGQLADQGGVAFWAHIGGFIAGVVIAKIFQGSGSKGYVEGEIVS